MVKAKNKKKGLNPQQEMFCQNYAGAGRTFGNEVWSYVLAYDIKNLPLFCTYKLLSRSEVKKYHAAQICSSRLLLKVVIKERCNEILDSLIKNEVVDRELQKVIMQSDELAPKVSAIREYNLVKKRIDEKPKVDVNIRLKTEGELKQRREKYVGELVRRRTDARLGKRGQRTGKKTGKRKG